MPDVAMVITREPSTAAILRAFLAVDGYEVAGDLDTKPLDGLLRFNPRLILVDVDHQDGFSPDFIEHARRRGVAVVAYSPSRTETETRRIAASLGLSAFGFPLRPSRFRETIRTASAAP